MNTVDIHSYGPRDTQRWCMLSGRRAQQVFESWGATEIVFIRNEGDLDRYMIRLEDGRWYYAHISGRPASAYCPMTESWDGAMTGQQAWDAHEAERVERNRMSTLRNLIADAGKDWVSAALERF